MTEQQDLESFLSGRSEVLMYPAGVQGLRYKDPPQAIESAPSRASEVSVAQPALQRTSVAQPASVLPAVVAVDPGVARPDVVVPADVAVTISSEPARSPSVQRRPFEGRPADSPLRLFLPVSAATYTGR